MQGKYAVLTRPLGHNENLADRLAKQGWQVCLLPALSIYPLKPTIEKLPLPHSFDMVIFVSGQAVRCYLEQLVQVSELNQWPDSTLTATVGAASAQALFASGWLKQGSTVLYPQAAHLQQDSQGLWEVLKEREHLPEQVLIVRGTHGQDWLIHCLQQHGVTVTVYAAYSRAPAIWLPSAQACLQQWIYAHVVPIWLLTSGESITALQLNLQTVGWYHWWTECKFILTHPKLKVYLSKIGVNTEDEAIVKVCLINEDAIFNTFMTF